MKGQENGRRRQKGVGIGRKGDGYIGRGRKEGLWGRDRDRKKGERRAGDIGRKEI